MKFPGDLRLEREQLDEMTHAELQWLREVCVKRVNTCWPYGPEQEYWYECIWDLDNAIRRNECKAHRVAARLMGTI